MAVCNAGSTCGSTSYTSLGFPIVDGAYQAEFHPLIAGTYTVNVEMTNENAIKSGLPTVVSGSGYQLTVYPGQVDPAQCYTSISGGMMSVAD